MTKGRKRLRWGLVGIACVLTLLLCVAVEPVGGAWSLLNSGGAWESVSHTSWECEEGDGFAYAMYTQTVANFSSWVFGVNVYAVASGGFLAYNTVTHVVMFNLSSSGGVVCVKVDLTDQYLALPFWVSRSTWVSVKYANSSSWVTIHSNSVNAFETYRPRDFSYRFYFVKNATNVLKFYSVELTDRNADTRASDFTETTFAVPSGFFSSTVLTQYLSKSGKGWVRGVKEGEQINGSLVYPFEGEPSEVWWLNRIWSALTSSIYNMLPPSLQSVCDMMGGWFGGIWSLLSVVWNTFLVILPLTPFIFVLYFIDALVTSVDRGSAAPVGAFVMGIVQMASNVGQWLVGIAQMLWSIIKIW